MSSDEVIDTDQPVLDLFLVHLVAKGLLGCWHLSGTRINKWSSGTRNRDEDHHETG